MILINASAYQLSINLCKFVSFRNINQQNNQGKFVSISKKENTNGNKILNVQVFLLQKS